MALAIDASTPAVATNPSGATTQSFTTASFTPPANSLLVILYVSDGGSPETAPTPTITDSLGSHLTYTLRVKSNALTTARNGQATIWTAPVSSSAAMTITLTSLSSVNPCAQACQVVVVTDGGTVPGIGVTSNNAVSGTSYSVSYTATSNNSWSFAAFEPWNAGSTQTAGSGTTIIATGTTPTTAVSSSDIDYAFARRTTADGVNGVANNININSSVSQTSGNSALFEVTSSGGGATAGSPVSYATPGQTWKRHFQHRQAQQPDPPVVVVAVPNFVPTSGVRRRWTRRMLPPQPSGSIVSPVASQIQPPRPRTSRGTRRRLPFPAYGPDSFSPPTGQMRVPSQYRRRLRRPRLPADGDAYSPPPNQTVPPVNPPVTQLTTGRLAKLLRGQRRPTVAAPTVQQGHVHTGLRVQPTRGLKWRALRRPGVANVVQAQAAAPVNPAITATVTRALRRWGLRKTGRTVMAPPAQQAAPTNPAITQLTSGRLRRITALRRPGIVNPTVQQGHVHTGQRVQPRPGKWRPQRRPTVVNPTVQQGHTHTGLRVQPQRGKWRPGRRPQIVNPVPAQQAAPTNPPITQLGSLWAKRWTLRRYGRVTNPTPGQQAAPTNPAITALTAVRGRLTGRGLRRGRISEPTPPQVAANPASTLTQLTGVRGRAVVHGAPRHVVAAGPPPPQAVPPAMPVARGRRGLRLRGVVRAATPPIQQATPPPQQEHRLPRVRRALRRLGFPLQGGAAPTSTAVSSVGSLGATATDLGSVAGATGSGATGGASGQSTTGGPAETGSTGGAGMTGSAQ